MTTDVSKDFHYVQPPSNRRFVECIQSGKHQEAWDYILLWTWLVHGELPAYYVRLVFCQSGGLVDGLKRCPEMMFGTVRVFVGNYLKQLSNKLWDKWPAWDEPSLWRLVAALGRSEMDCETSYATREGERIRAEARKLSKKIIAEGGAAKSRNEKASAWGNRGAGRAGYR